MLVRRDRRALEMADETTAICFGAMNNAAFYPSITI